MKNVKEWWFRRYSVVNVAFSIAFSRLCLRFIVLDYGVNFKIELPSVLDKLNPINWLTKGLFRIALKLWGEPDDFKFSKTWYKLAEHKRLEMEMMTVREIVSFDYHWKVNCDHWGHWLILAVAGLELSTHLYDTRHWDNENNAPKPHGGQDSD